MPRQRESVETISEIRVDPQPRGLRAVYMVETRSNDEVRDIQNLFAELELQMQVKQLSKGKLLSYAVQADGSDAALLDEIEDILKANYGFVVMHHSFDDLIYRIVKELSKDTESKVLPLSRCNICGKIEPFPNTVISLTDEQGSVRLSRAYCGKCTAEAAAPSNKEFVRLLLSADKHDFSILERAELVRHPSRKRPIRFRVQAGEKAAI